MSKPKASEVAAKAVAAVYEGHTYAEMDCQALIEYCVNKCGGRMAYAGSNDMARHAVYMATVENAKAEGRLVPGAGLMIHEETGEPTKYRGDGLGNFSHVGLYVGERALTDADKNGKTRVCNVVHSGQTIGRVAGSTLKNGWTHVVWFGEIDYGVDAPVGVAIGGALLETLARAQGAGAKAGDAGVVQGAAGGSGAKIGVDNGRNQSGDMSNQPPHSAAATDVSDFYTVRRGCKGGAVRRLQTWLAGLGYAMGGYGADGEFGAATDAAVRAFQQAQGLCADGIVGRKTWMALVAARQAANIADAKTATSEGMAVDSETAEPPVVQ